MIVATKWKFGDQEFDPRFDFFLCPTHGLIVPHRFSADWDSDCGCPVPTHDEESCDERLTAVFLGDLVPAPSSDHQGGRGLSREERDALGKRVFDNAVFEGQSVKLVNWGDAAAVIETLESLGYTLAPDQPPAPRGLSAEDWERLETAVADAVGNAFEAGRSGWSRDSAKEIAERSLLLLRRLADQDGAEQPDMANISGRSEAGDKPPITAHTEQPDTEGGDADAHCPRGHEAIPVAEGAAVDDGRALSELTEQPDTEGGDADEEAPQTRDRREVWARLTHVAEGAAVDDGRALSEHYVPKEQAEARLREVEAERDAAIEEGDRLKAAHRQAEQRLRSLLTDLQGEAGRIIDSGTWETPAAAAGRLEELIRKYAALSSTEQKGAGR